MSDQMCGPRLIHSTAYLEKYDLIVPTRKYGKTQLYKLTEENVVVKELLSLEMKLIENYAPADK